MNAQTKKCPMCAELIPLEATVCEYCGTQFEVEVKDGRVQSRFIEEALPEPAPPLEIKPAQLPEQKGNSWLMIPIIILIIGVVGGLLWFAGQRFVAPPAPTATATQAPTRVPAHTPSRAPNYKATTQAQSTKAAATAEFAWVENFAEPILSEIAGHSPNFEDDFSNMSGRFARWNRITGDVTFREGVMHMNGMADAGGSMIATDFVLEFEFNPRVASEGSTVAPGFRWNEGGGYDFDFHLYDNWWGLLSIPTEQDVRVVAEGWSLEAGLNRRTPVTIIAKGDRFAFYANGKPLRYAEDSSWSGEWAYLSVWTPNGPAEVDFDNVKFWDLNNLKP